MTASDAMYRSSETFRIDARCYAAEMIGTFALVFVGPGAIMVSERTGAFGHVSIALAFGLAVTLIVAAIGHLSGAHINPAVTIGFWSVKRFPRNKVLPYIAAQSAGAFAASALLVWLLGRVGNVGATLPALPMSQAFVVELVFTMLLGFVIMSVATDPRTPSGVAPFVIGATVFAGALVAGPLTGGSFNPARSLGPAIVGNIWNAHWIYWLAPIAGVAFGMHAYTWIQRAVPPTGALGVEGPLQ